MAKQQNLSQTPAISLVVRKKKEEYSNQSIFNHCWRYLFSISSRLKKKCDGAYALKRLCSVRSSARLTLELAGLLDLSVETWFISC